MVHIFRVDAVDVAERWHAEAHKAGMPEAQLEGCGANAAMVMLASAWRSRDEASLFHWEDAATELEAVRAI